MHLCQPAPDQPEPLAERRRRRLLGVDAARALALAGMMAVHITPSTTPAGDVSAAYLIAGGRASALFAVLAGVGLALASGGTTPPRGRELQGYRRGTAARAGVILVVGLTVGALEHGVAVILVHYAVLFVVALPFLGMRPAILIPLAATWVVVTPLISQALRSGMAIEPRDSPTLESLADPLDLISNLMLTGYYPVLVWTAYLLLGMGLGRLNLRALPTEITLLATGLSIAIAAKVASSALLEAGGGMDELRAAGAGTSPIAGRPLDIALEAGFFGTTPTTSWWWLATSAPHSGTPFDLLHTMGSAMGVLGAMLLLARVISGLLWPLAAIGSMTLTLYTLHVVLLATALPREMPNSLAWNLLVAVAIAVPWRTFVGRGPLEALAARTAAAARLSAGPPPRSLT
jgi:uncharacterized membrane protein